MKNAISVLLVDDEPMLRGATALMLTNRGADVRTAGSLRDALEQAALHAFDAMIIDLSGPPAEATAVIDALRTRALLPRRVVNCVARASGNAAEPGPHELCKPFDFERLVKLVFGSARPRRRTASGVFPQLRARVIPLRRRGQGLRSPRPRTARARRDRG
jgi:DNA-binding response OmpR family regulator